MFVNRRDVQIQWGDCDPANIVYYPRYFEMFDDSTSIMCSASEANSSACPSRCGNGIYAARLSCASCGRLASNGVRNSPGAMVSTRMPNCASSRAIGSVIATIPPFEAE